MQDGITWAQVGVVVTLIVGLGGTVKWVMSALDRRDKRIAEVKDELHQFKVLVAQTYVPVAAMSDAFKGVYGRLDQMNTRLDHMLAALAKGRQPGG